MERAFEDVDSLKDRSLAKARQVLRLAALLHDVGHGPFSHAAETVIHQGAGHEELTIQILQTPELLESDVDTLFFGGCAKLVAGVIGGGRALPPQLQILRDIVSGQMDADRTDYLLRDSIHCGVEYGRFDHRRMIESLELIEGPGGSLEIGLNWGGRHTFEALILARYQMNTQVYYHRTRRIYDYYLREYFKAKGNDWLNTPDKILAHNDVTIMAAILRDAQQQGDPFSIWARRIAGREHHRLAHETGEGTNAYDLRYARDVFEELQTKHPQVNFVFDISTATIHNLLLPEDQEAGEYEELKVIDSAGIPRQMGEQSHILRRVPRRFQVARIFCDLDESKEGLRTEISEFAARRFRELGGR